MKRNDRLPALVRAKHLVMVVLVSGLAAPAWAQPANDNPCGAVSLLVNPTCTYVAGTTLNATATAGVPAPGCASYVGADVWFSAVVPANGQLILNSNTGVILDGGMALYTAPSCSGPFALLECDDDDSPNGLMPYINRTGLVPGSTVYIRFWEFGGNNNGTFSICASVPPPPPGNDNPCGAAPLPVNLNCNYSTFSTAASTNTTGPPAPGCANFAGSDVWFSVVVPPDGHLTLNSTPGVITDGGMALYTAPSCSGPFTLLECDDDDSPNGLMPYIDRTGLVPGSTVYVRFWEYGGDNNGTFGICATGVAAVPAGDCVLTLNLFDSFGDGWGSSNVGVSINGGPFTYYTVTSFSFSTLIGVNIGNVVVFTYNNSGPFQGENSFSVGLMNGGGSYYNSPAPPSAGVAWTTTVTCNPPPAPPQDCVGSTTICNGQAFNNNSNNTGNVVDLTAANRGCLASGERQGTWYVFSPSVAGTIGFTINPVVTTDYDFAVWGPYPPGSTPSAICPPAGPPLRCSYAAPTGPTGCVTGAGDNSEGAGGNRWVNSFNVTVDQVYLLYVDNFSSNGQAFDLTWQLTNGASLDCTILPIELVNFSASGVTEGVDLRWTTASEENSDRFEIERSIDGEQFATIGTLDAAGTSNQQNVYSFLDRTPHHGLNHYRLRLVDIDGDMDHSGVRSVHVDLVGKDDVLLVPNPGTDHVQVLLPGSAPGSVFTLVDATGRIVMRQSTQGARMDISTAALPKGLYGFRLLATDGSVTDQGTWVRE